MGGNLCLNKMAKKIISLRNAYGFVLIFGILLMLTSFVSAEFGVGSPVSLNLYPGQSIDSAFSLQNTIEGTGDLTIEAIILEGGEYIILTQGNRFDVPQGGVVSLPIKVAIPENAKVGDVYKVKLLFRSVSGGNQEGGGMVQFKFNVEQGLEIGVVSKDFYLPKEEPNIIKKQEPPQKTTAGSTVWIWILVVIVIVIIAWMIWKKKNNN